jgi:hypothetical protein
MTEEKLCMIEEDKMQTAQNIDYAILKELEPFSSLDKKEILQYIRSLRPKKAKKTLGILNQTSGVWKDLIDGETLKRRIYSDRLLSTRNKVNF